MKQVKLLFMGLGIIACLNFTSCKKDSTEKGCEKAQTDVQDTFSAFDENSNAVNCAAYKAALNSVLTECTDLSDADKATYNAILATLPECVD